MESKTRNYLLFFVGVFLVAASLSVGIGAVHYEFELQSSHDSYQPGLELVEYGDLNANHQERVRQTVRDERIVVEDPADVPARRGEMQVRYRDTYYVFRGGQVFRWHLPAGLASIGLAVGGVGLVVEAVRAHHFPHVTLSRG